MSPKRKAWIATSSWFAAKLVCVVLGIIIVPLYMKVLRKDPPRPWNVAQPKNPDHRIKWFNTRNLMWRNPVSGWETYFQTPRTIKSWGNKSWEALVLAKEPIESEPMARLGMPEVWRYQQHGNKISFRRLRLVSEKWTFAPLIWKIKRPKKVRGQFYTEFYFGWKLSGKPGSPMDFATQWRTGNIGN